MKTKSRNLLTVILAVLCAVAVAIGVGFMLPKNQKTASAATNTPKVTFGSAQFVHSTAKPNSSTTPISAAPSHITYTAGTDSISANITGGQYSSLSVPMTLNVKVPAYTVYKIKMSYTLTLTGPNGREAGLLDVWSVGSAGTAIAYDWALLSGGHQAGGTGLYTYTSGSRPPAKCGNHHSGNTIYLYNDTAADKNMQAGNCFYFAVHEGSSYAYSASLNFTNYDVKVEKIGDDPSTTDKTPETYDGTNKTFNFTFAEPDITDTDPVTSITYSTACYNIETTVTAADFDGNTISSSDYTLNVDSSASKGSLTAQKAGTYTVKFNISATAKGNGIEWGGGGTSEKTLTFTINRKALTIPTVTVPQEYSGSALTFVLADFNSGTDISMDGVTPPTGCTVTGAGGAALTDTMGTFEATNVGKYTVSLSLRDSANHKWSDNTTAAKTVDFEITQKELLSAAPSSSKVNSIGGAEWKFGDSTVTITITDNRATGEVLDLFIYYDDKSHTLTGTTAGNVTTVTMPNDIAVGTHTFYVELNGSTGANANYKITKNNTLSFAVTSATIDPSTYGWTYTKDGTAGATIKDGDKLPFELKAGSTVDGVKYEVSIQIPTADATTVVVDTAKYSGGYQVHSGDKVGKYKTVVALKSTDPTFEFDVGGVKQSTIDVELNWEIEKGTFDLSGVEWEYTTDNGKTWTEYDENNPPQYNDGNYVTVRVKSGSLPLGLTLDPMYDGDSERTVGSYTATISSSDLVYNTSNFNAPDTSKLVLNWEIAKKNLFTAFTNSKEPYSNASYSGTIILKKLKFTDTKFEDYVEYKYYDMKTGLPVTLADIKAATDPTDEKKYKVEAYIKPAYDANYEVLDNGATPQDQFKTGSKNVLATATVDGKDGSTPITVEYDGNDHYDLSVIKVVGDDGLTITDYTVTYYKGKTPVAGNELAAGELPKDAGDYCIEIVLGPIAEKGYILGDDWFTVTVEAKGIAIPTLGQITFNGKEQNFVDFLSGDDWNTYGPVGKDIIKVDGKLSDRNVSAGNYSTTLTITDTNYKWIYPSSKSVAKYSRAVGAVKVTGDDVVATYNWNITPLIVDTTNMWSKSKTGATLNLPQNIRDFIAGGTLD
ncbi:MAG: hypothetical protein K2N22_04065, partial [Clostridia bacterium]|nr:hypothetical protein [Clostridia bacterium]